MNRRAAPVRAALIAALAAAPLAAQLNERPDDPTGLSIREPRVLATHSEALDPAGGTLHLQRTDPWLAYRRGHSLFHHEWSAAEGAFAALPPRPIAAATNSCGMCHNLPFRSAGSGGNAAEPVGVGRNAPHLFGAGLVESIGLQIRADLLAAHDRNRNGFLDLPAETRGARAVVEAAPGATVDLGSFDDLDGDGRPDLDDLLLVTFVDTLGRPVVVPGRVTRLDDPGVVGIDVAAGILSAAVSDHQALTLRQFANGVLLTVFGLRVEDGTCGRDDGMGRDLRADDGWAEVSNAGAPQPYLPAVAERSGDGRPPGEGMVGEGDLDLLEWYLLNHPPPASGPRGPAERGGEQRMVEMGCTGCHLPEWRLKPRDEARGLPGDRRFFHLRVAHDPATGRLEGRLEDLTEPGPEAPAADGARSRERRPRYGGFAIAGIYSDFRHHDLGERFREYSYDGAALYYLVRFRTPPLWGVGSTAPYGHDGASPTLDAVIRRHGGEAEASARAYAAASAAERGELLAFLESLVLYQPDVLPADLDGDGRIAEDYRRDGLELGPERFQPELLFAVAPRYRGWVEDEPGDRYFSFALLNTERAYGLDLEALADHDGDGVPDRGLAAAGPAGEARASPRRSTTRKEEP
jgi:hypothetical protein